MQRRARSNYRQVRITLTEEAGGRLSARVMVKPLEAGWTMRHTVWVHSWLQENPSAHWQDLVYAVLRQIAGEDLLPGID